MPWLVSPAPVGRDERPFQMDTQRTGTDPSWRWTCGDDLQRLQRGVGP